VAVVPTQPIGRIIIAPISDPLTAFLKPLLFIP